MNFLVWADNLVENLLGDFEYEVQVPYLLYRNASQEVNGIWFYNARECEEVANLFSRYCLACIMDDNLVICVYVCVCVSGSLCVCVVCFSFSFLIITLKHG